MHWSRGRNWQWFWLSTPRQETCQFKCKDGCALCPSRACREASRGSCSSDIHLDCKQCLGSASWRPTVKLQLVWCQSPRPMLTTTTRTLEVSYTGNSAIAVRHEPGTARYQIFLLQIIINPLLHNYAVISIHPKCLYLLRRHMKCILLDRYFTCPFWPCAGAQPHMEFVSWG